MFHSGFASTWCLPGRLPVSSEARAGVQIAVGVKALVKAKPSRPIRSMTGVRAGEGRRAARRPRGGGYRSSKTNSWSGASTASTLSASSASALPPREWRCPWTRTHWSGSTCVPAGASTANPRA